MEFCYFAFIEVTSFVAHNVMRFGDALPYSVIVICVFKLNALLPGCISFVIAMSVRLLQSFVYLEQQ